MPEIGETLREARMRAHIDVSEIEAQTKIRSKYLRAMENEEWDLLPGPSYITSFLRTYARALGLDSKQLLEEYRRSHERGNEAELQPIQGPRRARPNEPPPRGLGPRLLLGGLAVVAVLLVVGLLTQVLGNGGKKKPGKSPTAGVTTSNTISQTTTTTSHTRSKTTTKPKLTRVISLQLIPTGKVYVCLTARNKTTPLVPGETLNPGQTTKVFHARHFYLVLGDNAVRLRIDGTDRTVPASATPIGYSITKKGRHRESTSKLPTCG